tara:strand:- start:931 stop:1296 length:366 start_codon:yes stop_codon:yes gene_type:complete
MSDPKEVEALLGRLDDVASWNAGADEGDDFYGLCEFMEVAAAMIRELQAEKDTEHALRLEDLEDQRTWQFKAEDLADRIEELERENKRWIRSAFLESQRENKRLLEKILPSCTDEGGTSNE